MSDIGHSMLEGDRTVLLWLLDEAWLALTPHLPRNQPGKASRRCLEIDLFPYHAGN